MTRDHEAEARATRLGGDERALYESFRSVGMGPAAAMGATVGRDGRLSSSSGFDRLTESFEGLGLSPRGARIAAIGHASEREVRETLDRTTATTSPSGSAASGGDACMVELLERSGFSVEEAARIAGVEPERRVRDHAAGREAVLSESSARFRARTLSLAERVNALEHGPRRLSFLDALHEAEAELRAEARHGA